MLELSCTDYTFPLLDRRQALALIHLLQFDFVDIGLFARNPHFLPSALHAAPREFIHELEADLVCHGLRAADVFLQVGNDPTEFSINDPSSAARELSRDTFASALDLCHAIECSHLTGLPGVLHGDATRDMALAVEETAWRVEAASGAGVTYSIEPHVGSICGDVASTCAFLALVPGLTLTLDYGHFIFQGEASEAIHPLLSHASHMHLRGAAHGQLQASVAESTVDLPHILRTLSTGYKGRCALEYVWTPWHACNRTDNLSETVRLRQQIAAIEAHITTGAQQHV